LQPAACWWLDPQQQQPQSVAHFGMTAAQPFLFATDWTAAAAMATNAAGEYQHCGDATAMAHQLAMMHQQQQQHAADVEAMLVSQGGRRNLKET
jgi:hypothetical protein